MLPALVLLSLFTPQDLKTHDETGLRVAPGFKISRVSGPETANDLYAMTLDPKGRVVVTSQGWIRTLHDDDGDGKADRATDFAPTRTGGMGMCFDGNDLLFTGEGGVWRFRDADGDGKADGPPERLLKIDFGEHGGHAIRKGPDGHWYVIGGNDAAIGTAHVTREDSPIRSPEAGAILRATPDWSKLEVLAHGFRNPYDFDFNAQGDLFAYDSDCERDFFLPWYTPTRLYHVGIGMHHGWRLKGYLRSFCRLDWYPDTVDVLWPVGRGSPTGVAAYRHTAYPERYRGGVFYADWTFGRVWFTPLVPEGASYKPQAEVFLEPSGSEGFAPTDLCVAPDGALLVSIGGRRTRGAVYRISPEIPGKAPGMRDDLDRVLRAPQPLDAWSRAIWEPLARKLGAKGFEEVLLDSTRPTAERVRAVDVLTDLFPGSTFRGHRDEADPQVRARLAASFRDLPSPAGTLVLAAWAADPDARVRLRALEAAAVRGGDVDRDRWVNLNLDHPDKRVRQAAARLASVLPEDAWRRLKAETPQAKLTWVLASLWRAGPGEDALAETLEVLEAGKLPEQAIRLVILALGDSNLHKPPVEVHSNYSLPAAPSPERRERILKALRPLFPSGIARVDLEASRLLAMLEDEAAETVAKVAGLVTAKSTATDDVHTLIVLSRLKGPWPEGLAEKVAGAMLSLGRKLEGQGLRTKLVWGPRLAELAQIFVRRDPAFGQELLKHPQFPTADHVDLGAALPDEMQLQAARLFLQAARRDAGFAWSERLIGLLARLGPGEFHPLLRGQWSNFALRDTVVVHLASQPDPRDREKFLAGAESAHAGAARAALEALEKLPRDEEAGNLVPLLRLLRRLTLEPDQGPRRKQVTALVARQSGRPFEVAETGTDPQALRLAYRPLFDAFPELRAELEGGDDPATLREVLSKVPWDRGDAGRGAGVFRARGCQTCHAVQGALGPNLAGAATRFSREDLFEAIANPSKDVAPLYRTTVFLTKDGQVHTGTVAFESADGYIVQTGATTTVRVSTPDIAAMRPGTLSLMPNDLLKGLTPGDLADLYAHLRTLGMSPR